MGITAAPRRVRDTMALCLTIADLDKLKPCPDSGRRVRAALRKSIADKAHCYSAADARAAGCSFDDIAWAVTAMGRTDPAIERRIRLFLNDCAIRALPIFEARFPNDDRPRRAIMATAHVLAEYPAGFDQLDDDIGAYAATEGVLFIPAGRVHFRLAITTSTAGSRNCCSIWGRIRSSCCRSASMTAI